MVVLGELTLAGHRFPIRRATFRRITDDGHGQPGWEFNIRTQPPIDEPADEGEQLLFARGVRFYAEGDPIPLPNMDDLTGTDLFIEEPFDPESGEVYFNHYVCEHQHVSRVRLRVLERRGEEYRITVSALAHNLFAKPAELAFETWITQQAAIRYGANA